MNLEKCPIGFRRAADSSERRGLCGDMWLGVGKTSGDKHI